jgi:hypothetical protein
MKNSADNEPVCKVNTNTYESADSYDYRHGFPGVSRDIMRFPCLVWAEIPIIQSLLFEPFRARSGGVTHACKRSLRAR